LFSGKIYKRKTERTFFLLASAASQKQAFASQNMSCSLAIAPLGVWRRKPNSERKYLRPTAKKEQKGEKERQRSEFAPLPYKKLVIG
jgi:hypothetical protein